MVRFFAENRIKQHASLRLLRNRLFFLISLLQVYSQGGMVNAFAQKRYYLSKRPFIVYSGGYKSSKFFFLSPPSYLNVNLFWKTAFAISILFSISVCRHYTKYYIFLKLDTILFYINKLIKSLSAYTLSLIMMENLAPLALPSLLAPGFDGTQNLILS